MLLSVAGKLRLKEVFFSGFNTITMQEAGISMQ